MILHQTPVFSTREDTALMGILAIIKANIGSISQQKEIEKALLLGNHESAKVLIAESISKILKAGLTKNQLSILEQIKADHKDLVSLLLVKAFDEGWSRDGKPNLSNAMDSALRAAQEIVKEYKTTMRA
jgi:hypothetical protein